jgi:hypothetical protein
MRLQLLALPLIATLLALPLRADAAPAAIRWRQLQPGLRYATLPLAPPPGINIADRQLHLVKLDAAQAARLRLGLASQSGEGRRGAPKGDRQGRTAADWSKKLRLAVTINLGMYYEDHVTHVGYLRSGKHENSKRWLPKYDSLLTITPTQASILDRSATRPDSPVLVQNLRLIRSADGKTGVGVWSKQEKRWSEAALAMDRDGNLLFIFTRVPLSMWELSRLLLGQSGVGRRGAPMGPLGIVRAMHLEGGPEASLSIHAGGVDLDLCGSFETGFFGSDLNTQQWPLPNVLGVARR